jgi:glycosyltransferase involved in cell wall biosynthesis
MSDETGRRSRPIRVVTYTDSNVIGGAENCARDLLALLGPEFVPCVAGTSEAVVAHIASRRSTIATRVLPPVAGRGDFASIREHARVIRELGADVVHINQHLWTGQYGVLASALAGVPQVCAVHGTLPASSASQRYLTMCVARLVPRFVGVSASVTSAILDELHLPASRVLTIYNGVSASDDLAKYPAASRRSILGIGRLAPEKGFDVLIEALKTVPDCRLVIAGDGPERPALERLAHRLDVKDRVEFVGWVTEPWADQMRPQLVVVPSRFEAMSLVILEAMHAGLPVVATLVGGMPEVVADTVTGLLVEPEDPVALGAAIGDLLDDPRRCEEMGAAGQSRARELFGEERSVAAYEAVYRDLAARHRARGHAGRRGRARATGAAEALVSLDPTATAVSGEAGFAEGAPPRWEWLRGMSLILPPELRGLARARLRALRKLGAFTQVSGRRAAGLDFPEAQVGQFVIANLDGVRGRVLETERATFTSLAASAGAVVDESVVWDLEPHNLGASLMVDLAADASLGTDRYDCEIVIGVPWQPGNAERALANLCQALRPGGSLLLALPPGAISAESGTTVDLGDLLTRCLPSGRLTLGRGMDVPPDHRSARARSERLRWEYARADRSDGTD